MSRHGAFASAAAVFVVAGIALGFWNLGGPSRQREINADERRSSDLARISGAIGRWYQADGKLPPDIDAVRAREPGLTVQDPVTHAMYPYKPAAGSKYQLCATFARNTEPTPVPPWQDARFAPHPAGDHCFSLDARTNWSRPAIAP